MSPNLKASCLEIFRECFEGVKPGSSSTWFVQGNEAIFLSLDSITPARASLRAFGQTATIGAHAFHLCYYLSLFNATNRGENPKGDWTGSWKIQEFDKVSWEEVATKTKQEFDEAARWFESEFDFHDQESATYAIANIAHAAYHLGAIRALIPIVQ